MNAVNKLTFINENQKSRGSVKRRKQRACVPWHSRKAE